MSRMIKAIIQLIFSAVIVLITSFLLLLFVYNLFAVQLAKAVSATELLLPFTVILVFISIVIWGYRYFLSGIIKYKSIAKGDMKAEEKVVDSKKKNIVVNTLIIGFIILLLYYFTGHDFVKFYFGGKSEMLKTAELINKLCNDNGSCPTTLDGWRAHRGVSETLSKDNMLYFVNFEQEIKDSDKSKEFLSFRLTYRFFVPDHWFEVQGGVGKKLNSGWKSR